MPSLPRPWVLFLSLILMAALGITSLAFYSSGQVETGLKSLAAHTQCKGLFTVRNLVHDRGLFSSWGTADLDIKPACGNGSKAADPALLSFKIEYQVNHLPSLAGMSQFHWIGKPGNDALIDLSQLASSGAIMEGQGKLTYGLKTDSTITMGDLEIASDSDRLNIKGIQGAILAGGDEVRVELQSQKLLVLSSDTSLEAEHLNIKADIVDWRTANGTTELQIDSVTMPLGALKGLRLASQSSDNGTTLSSATQIGIREINALGQRIEGLELDLALEGLDKKHIETLTQVMESLTQEGTPNPQSITQACEAGTGLIHKGFAFKITKIAGKKAEGALSGDLSLEVRPAKSGAPYRASNQIASSGSLLMSHLLDPQEVQQALATGYVSQSPEGLRVSYLLSDGILKVGDRMVDTPEIRTFFKELDQNVLEVFNNCSSALSVVQPTHEVARQAQAIPEPEVPAEDIPVEEESAGDMTQATQGDLSELNRFRAKETMEKADAAINQLWKSAPKERRQAVLKDQREWLKLRDKTCRDAAQALGDSDDLLKDTTQFTCLAEMTRARIETLKEIFAAPVNGTP
ncbi:MAG: hypothetical protein RLZ25_120 [Pseudomonadota bacterium]|jgi:uncharacterized protein YecT (DUF1311 family)